MNNAMYPEDQREALAQSAFKLKASIQTYELSLADLAQLFARELGVPASRISITAKERDVSGPMDHHLRYAFDGLVVTIKNQ